MAELYDAALAWRDLLDTTYEVTYGKKGKLETFNIAFREENFYHLCGAHHLDDVDFKIPYIKKNAAKFFQRILAKKIDDKIAHKSQHWEENAPRVRAVTNIERILDGEYDLFLFDRNRTNFFTRIKAKLMIRDRKSDEVIFLFLDGELEQMFCKSTFNETNRDFSANQVRVTVLKKVKIVGGEEQVLMDRVKPQPRALAVNE